MNFSNPYTVDTRLASIRALGLKGANGDWVAGDGNIALASGTTRYGYIALNAGDVVTNVHCWVDVVAATVTTIKGGLYSYSGTTGTLLGASANTTAAFNALGLATLVLSSPYTAPTTGHYLIAFLSVATTPGSLLGLATGGATGKGSSSVIVGGTEAGQTDLDASSTIGTSSVSIWVGWS